MRRLNERLSGIAYTPRDLVHWASGTPGYADQTVEVDGRALVVVSDLYVNKSTTRIELEDWLDTAERAQGVVIRTSKPVEFHVENVPIPHLPHQRPDGKGEGTEFGLFAKPGEAGEVKKLFDQLKAEMSI